MVLPRVLSQARGRGWRTIHRVFCDVRNRRPAQALGSAILLIRLTARRPDKKDLRWPAPSFLVFRLVLQFESIY